MDSVSRRTGWRVCIDAYRLPVTHFTIAFPNALFAVNPFNIQVSREAYFYASLILGGCLLYLGVITAVQAVCDNGKTGYG